MSIHETTEVTDRNRANGRHGKLTCFRDLSSFPCVPWFLCFVAFAMVAPMPSAQTETTVRDGVYSAEQARRGRAIYDTKCASCHDGGTMGPELWGDPFLAEWENKTVGAFYARIQTTMPEDAPGSLSESEVLDVVAYVLQTNGFKAGDKEIRADALATVRFVRK